MNKKIKMLFILLAFIFTIFLFNNKSNAYSINYENYILETDLDVQSYVCVKGIYGDRSILLSCVEDSYFAIRRYNSNYQELICLNSSGGSIGYYRYDIGSSSKPYQMDGTWKIDNSILNSFFVYASHNVINKNDNSIFFAGKPILPNLEWSFDRQVNTIIMSSQHFTLNEISKYNLYYTTDSSKVSDYKNLDTASLGSFTDTSNNDTSYFYFLSFDNYYNRFDTYYFILEDKESGEILTSTMNIDFDGLNEYFDEQLNEELKNNGIYGEAFSNGIPNLKMTYKRYTNADNTYYYQISSQYFSQYEITDQYIAYYTNDTTVLENYSQWDTLNIATFNNIKTGQTDYYYFFNTPTDSENTTYYFLLYNKITGQYSSISSLTLDYEAMWEYSEQLNNDNGQVTTRFDDLINYLKDRFGFITYPFELIGDIFNRFYSIDWQAPIIKIPSLSVPIYGQKLTDEITYNFNDLLSIPIVKYIHDIYLIIADVILIYAVIQFGMKVFEEVFGNG